MQTIEIPVLGMDCAECTVHVREAIAALPGVAQVDVYLASDKAVVRLDPRQVTLDDVRAAVTSAGYSVPDDPMAGEAVSDRIHPQAFSRRVLTVLGVLVAAILLVGVVGEGLGIVEAISEHIPWPIGLALTLTFGWPVFVNVARAAWRRQIIAHTVMTVGVVAAAAIGQWITAALVVFFMRVGEYTERLTTERARQAVKGLMDLAPRRARVERHGQEVQVPVTEVQRGEIVVVRPGERIPVDGVVVDGQCTVDQSAITGEAMPVEITPGKRVFAATIVQTGSARIRVTHLGSDTAFGRIVRLVEQAESHRAGVQRLADRFSSWYLPVVLSVAVGTFLLRGDVLATAAVLVVACSCGFALATPIAMLASIGAAARQGLLIKGGRYLEALAWADVLLLDKTGTLTLGKPQVTDVVVFGPWSAEEVLALAAAAERYSEHPLGRAVVEAAQARRLPLEAARGFESVTGFGVQARVQERTVRVGSARHLGLDPALGAEFESQGKTVLFVQVDGQLAGMLAVADGLRSGAGEALQKLRKMGFGTIELLTGDQEGPAALLARQLGIGYRARLLPEEKIEVVRAYQRQGHTVVMVGDGVNDAPALAQADVGIAMGDGTDVAVEAGHVVLLRPDWRLVPQAVSIARRTMGVVKGNLVLTAVYNLVGLSLAALGYLPPILAAALQSLPDVGIVWNSSRLLRQEGGSADGHR